MVQIDGSATNLSAASLTSLSAANLAGGRGDALVSPQPGHTYSGQVVAQLGPVENVFQLRVKVLGGLLEVMSTRNYPVGTLLDLEASSLGKDIRLRIVGQNSALSAHALAANSAVTSSPGVVQDSALNLTRNLASHGVRLDPSVLEQLRAAGGQVAASDVELEQAIRRLNQAQLPLSNELLRGQIVAQRGSGLDITEVVAKLMSLVDKQISSEADQQRLWLQFSRAMGGLEPSKDGSANLQATWARVRPQALQAAYADLVGTLFRQDPTLAAIEKAFQSLEAQPSSSRMSTTEVEQRIRQLVDGGRAFALNGLLQDLSPAARKNMGQLLQFVQQERAEQKTYMPELRELGRELQQRTDAVTYLQALEASGQQDGESQMHLIWQRSHERFAARIRVHDRRKKGGGQAGLGFQVQLESPTLGSMQITGRLQKFKPGQPSGLLQLEFETEDSQLRKVLIADFNDLQQTLDALGYQSSAVAKIARANTAQPEIKANSMQSRGLDLRA